jgi:acyl CoA:acetate/3-ketoacid CoA transferase alpha subunit
VEQGQVKSEDYDHLSMMLRYLAGAMGLSFIPTKAGLGSDIMRLQVLPRKKVAESNCSFTGEKYLLFPACTPDVAVIHVTRADEQGNCQIDGTFFADEYIAKASKTVIVVAEQIVPTETELTILRNRVGRVYLGG